MIIQETIQVGNRIITRSVNEPNVGARDLEDIETMILVLERMKTDAETKREIAALKSRRKHK